MNWSSDGNFWKTLYTI